LRCLLLLGDSSASPFIDSSGGRGVQKTLEWCLGGEGMMGAIEVAVATCPGEGRPSLGCHDDVEDGMVKSPGSCGGRAIFYSRRVSVVPLLIGGARGLVGT
jgi:hypothetical protein